MAKSEDELLQELRGLGQLPQTAPEEPPEVKLLNELKSSVLKDTPPAPPPLPPSDEEQLLRSLQDAGAVPREERPSIGGEFTRGLKRGAAQEAAGLTLTGAALADLFGAEETARGVAQETLEAERRVQEAAPAVVPSIRDVGSVGDFARYAAGLLGEQAPIVASIASTAGIVGRLGRRFAERRLRREVVDDILAEAVKRRAVRRAATGGAVAGASVLEAGGIAGESFEATGDLEPEVALTAGVAAGMLEAVTPLALVRRLGFTRGEASSFLNQAMQSLERAARTRTGRVAALAAGGAGSEAATELAQEAIAIAARDFVDEKFSTFDPERRQEVVNRLIDAAAAGLVVGGAFAGGAGLATRGAPLQAEPSVEDVIRQLGREEEAAQQQSRSVAFATAEPQALTPSPELTPEGERVVRFRRAEDFIGDTINEGLGLNQTPPDTENLKRFRVDMDELTPETSTVDIRDLPAVLDPDADPRIHLLDMGVAREALRFAQEAVRKYDFGAFTTAKDLYLQAIDKGFRYEPFQGDSFLLIGDPAVQLEEEGGPLPIPRDLFRGPVFIPNEQPFPEGSILVPGGHALTEESNAVRAGGAFHVDLRRISRSRLANLDAKELSNRLPAEALESNEALLAALQAMPEVHLVEGFSEGQLGSVRGLLKVAKSSTSEGLNTIKSLGQLANVVRAYDPSVEGPIFVSGTISQRARTLIPFAPRWARRTAAYQTSGIAEMQLDLARSKLLSGKEYDPAKHNFGTVQTVVFGSNILTSSEEETLNRIAAFYEELMERYKLRRRKLVLAPTALPSSSEATKQAGGAYRGPAGSDTAFIYVDITSQSEADIAATAAHEFGHFLVYTEWESLPAAMQDKLHAAYDRYLLRAFLSQGTVGFLEEFTAAPRVLEWLKDTDVRGAVGDFTDAILDLETSGVHSQGLNYWYSMDEFMAEQMARFVTTDAQPLGVLEKFFAGVGQKVLEAIEFFKKNFGLLREEGAFEAAPEFKAFLESLRARREAPDLAPLSSEGLHLAHATSELEANKVLQPLQIQGVSAQPETLEMDNMLRGLNIPKKKRDEVRALTDRFGFFSKWGLTLQQVAQRNPHITGLQMYREFVDRWRTERMEVLTRSDLTVRDWTDLGPDQSRRVGEMLFAIDAMEYLTAREVENETVRKPTPQEEAEIAQRLGLSQAGFDMYTRIKEQLEDFIDQMEEATLVDVEALVRENAARGGGGIIEELLTIERARVKAEFNALRRAPYFPHMRFGNFIVAVKEGNETVFSAQFNTQREARQAAQRLRSKYPEQTHTIFVDRVPEAAKTLAGMPPTVLKALRTRLNLSDEQESQLDAFIAEHLPSRSFRQRLLRRRNIAGFSTDAMRSYAAYFFHGAGYLARLKWGGRLTDSINTMEDEKRDLKNAGGRGVVPDVSRRTRIIDFVRDHLQHIMDPKPDWAQLRSAAFMWHLGFNPKSALVNLTQVPLVTGPYLAARFGDARALGALRKAMTDFKNTWAKERGDIEKRDDRFFEMINMGISQGFLNESLARELADVAVGSNLQLLMPGPGAARKMRMLSHWGAYMFQTAEKVNRSITFRAAVDLARSRPNTEYLFDLERENPLQVQELQEAGWNSIDIRAFLAGRDAVWKTQFQYQREARPRFMRGKAGTLFTFFMFTQNMMFFATQQPGRGRYLLAMLFLAGLMGLPGAEDAGELAKFIARRLYGSDFDVEKEAREIVLALLGEDPAVPPDVFLHGISRVGFGIPHAADTIGIPIPEFDMSASIGMGNVVPGLREIAREGNFEERFSSVTTDVAGATFGTGINILKALGDDRMPFDDFKRWERAMPSAIRNISRAYRFGIEGAERTRSGAIIAEFSASDPKQMLEAVFAGAGFTSTRIARKWDREIMKMEVQNFWAGQREALMRQFDQADAFPPSAFGGRPAKADVLDDIKRFNREVPYRSLVIRPSDLRASKKGRVRDRKLFERGFGGGKRNIPVSRDINRLFPETKEEPAPR